MDMQELADHLGLEEEEFIVLIELFLETSVSDLSKMEEGLDQGDMGRIVEAAHSIRGASGNLGFAKIHQMANGVEMKARENSPDGLPEALREIREALDEVSEHSGCISHLGNRTCTKRNKYFNKR